MLPAILGPNPDGDWCTSIPAPWTPVFQISAYRTIEGTDGIHYISDTPPNGFIGGMTDPDGRATIFPFSFEWAQQMDDPGPLAIGIHHETVHYEDLITIGWDTHERMEVRAFNESLKMIDAFLPMKVINGISVRYLFKDAFEQIIASSQRAIDAGEEHSPFLDRDQEAVNKREIEKGMADETAYLNLRARVEKEREARAAQDAASSRKLRWMRFNVWSLYACMYITGPH